MLEALGVIFPPLDEDYGYVTLEAMLAAKPVITCTDSGGPLEFVGASRRPAWSFLPRRRSAGGRDGPALGRTGAGGPPLGRSRAGRTALLRPRYLLGPRRHERLVA